MRIVFAVAALMALASCTWSSDHPSQPAPNTTVVVPQNQPSSPPPPPVVVCSDGSPPPCQ